jgi:hypothetical protein
MADDPNANPATELYQQSIASAANGSVSLPPFAGDDTFTITGTLSGEFGGPQSVASSSAPIAPAFNLHDILKLAVIAVIATWIGSALFGGNNGR